MSAVLGLSEEDIEEIKEEVAVALDFRKKARTFRSSVGISIRMYDGKIFGGFNMETYPHKGYHAEEVGVITALAEGYNHTDFKRMTEVFQDAGHSEVEIFPGCPYHCWGTFYEFCHPYLQIVVADTEGKVRYKTRLNEIIRPEPPALVYPSNLTRKTRPKLNTTPKLPLNPELKVFYDKDSQFKEFCDIIKIKIE